MAENLIKAIKAGDGKGVEELLKLGVKPNALWNGSAALHVLAATPGKASIQILELLLEYGADVSAINSAFESSIFIAAATNDLQFLKKIIKYSEHFDWKSNDFFKQGILNYVAVNQEYGREIISDLIKDINVLYELARIDDDGQNALFGNLSSSATCANLALMWELGGDINQIDKGGNRAALALSASGNCRGICPLRETTT